MREADRRRLIEEIESLGGVVEEQPEMPQDWPPEKKIITVEVGELPAVVDEAEQVLLPHARRLGLFQRGGELVRITRLPTRKIGAGLDRPEGTLQLTPVRSAWLLETLEALAEFEKPTEKGPQQINCPNKIPTTYLARTSSWKLPALEGIISAPLMRGDGSILDRPGYDSVTGLYFASRESWPRIPSRPTREDAAESLRIMLDPFDQFPFVEQQDRAVHAAAILTAIQRRLLAACPITGYSAPCQRTGKSLLSESVAIIAIGKPAPATSASPHREEIRKSVTAALREGHPVINLDNIEHVLHSPDLARAITQGEYADRLLGENKMLRLPTTVLWLATGNNLAFRGDLSSRALISRIDAGQERPEQRTFKIPNLPEYLREKRRELVAAALTLLRAYRLAGRPMRDLPPWGGFETWSAEIREPLVWAGAADPCLTRQAVIDDDPDRESTATLLAALQTTFQGDSFTIKEVMDRATPLLDPNLREALLAVAGHKDNIDSRALGWWARRWRDRIVDRRRLRRANTESTSAAKWRIEES